MNRVETKGQTSFIDVQGKNIQLLKLGQGPPLLYLHSAGGEADEMPFHTALAEHFTVYAPAHPGFAVSTGLEEIQNVVDLAWHYVDLLDVLGLERVPVVGFSLGAWIGVQLAILRPQLVSKLVLVNAAGLRVEGAPMGEIFIDDLQEMRELIFYDPQADYVELATPGSLDDPRILHWIRAREATARVGWNPYLHDPDLPAHLRRVECPVHVLWGREDKLIPLAHGEFYAEHIPNAQLTVLDECGHMLPFEKCEEFVALTRKFVDS